MRNKKAQDTICQHMILPYRSACRNSQFALICRAFSVESALSAPEKSSIIAGGANREARRKTVQTAVSFVYHRFSTYSQKA